EEENTVFDWYESDIEDKEEAMFDSYETDAEDTGNIDIFKAGEVETAIEGTVQEIAQIKGIIKNSETNRPVPDITVKVVDQDGEAKTDADGSFTIDIIRTELDPDLVIEDPNYRIKYVNIQESDYIRDMEILIDPVSGEIQELEKMQEFKRIKVREQEASQTIVMGPSEKMSQLALNPENVDKLPFFGEADISRTLQLFPGISGSNESSAGLYVRGGTPDQNIILMDGFTIYNIDHFFGFLSVFHTDAIDEVLMTKGGFPAIYGGRASSIMEIKSRTADFEKFSAGAGLGFLSADLAFEIPLFSKGSIMIAARRTYTDFLQSNVYNNIFSFFNGIKYTSISRNRWSLVKKYSGRTPLFHFFDINNRIMYCPAERDSISFNLYMGRDILINSGEDIRISENLQRIPGGETRVYGNTRLNKIDHGETQWGNLGISLIWNRNWLEKYQTNLTIAYSKYHSDEEFELKGATFYGRSDSIRTQLTYFYSAAGQQQQQQTGSQVQRAEIYRYEIQNNDVYDFSIKLDNHVKIIENNVLSFGAQAKVIKTSCTDRGSSTVLRSSAQGQPVDTLEEIPTPFNWKDNGIIITGYLQDKWILFDRLTLFPGIRANYFNGIPDFYIEPRVTLQWEIIDELKIKGDLGIFSQFVNRVTLDDIMRGSRDMWFLAYVPDTPVKPARPVIDASHCIGGVTFSNSFLLVDIEAYYKKMEGLTMASLRNFSNMNTFFQGTGEAAGIEFLVKKNAGQHTGWASYTLSRVLHTFPELNKGKPFPAPHDKTHELKIVYNFVWKGLNASAVWIYATGVPYTKPIYRYYLQTHTGEWNEGVITNGYNRERIPNYHRLDLSVSYNFYIREKNKLIVGLSVFNLYNKENIRERVYKESWGNMVQADKKYLGITPSLFFNYNFK
ncbi:MAG: TonB-dependent receptor, partial [Chitinispirillia bacterium]